MKEKLISGSRTLTLDEISLSYLLYSRTEKVQVEVKVEVEIEVEVSGE